MNHQQEMAASEGNIVHTEVSVCVSVLSIEQVAEHEEDQEADGSTTL